MLAGRSRSLLGLFVVVAASTRAADPLAVVPLTYSPGTQYLRFSSLVSATGGAPPYTWSLAGGSLPAGLELSAAGFINGTPTVAGQFSFNPQVRDSQGSTATGSLSITIQPSEVNTLRAEPAQLSFTLTEGSSATQQACVSVSATQHPVEVRGSFAPVPWLSASGTTIQQTPATYCLTVNASSLTARGFPYVHYFSIGTTSIADFAIGVSVEVSLTIQPAVGNALIANPTQLSFTLPEGNSKSQPSCISVFSTQAAVQVEGYVTGTWLSATGAVLQQTPATYCITADATGLAPRSYTTYFTATYRDLVSAPLTASVPVTVDIQAAANPARLEVSPLSLKLAGSRGGAAVNGSVLLTNSGGSGLSYTVRRPEASWLTTTAVLGDLSGGSSTSVPLRADPTGLSPGVYRTTLVIDALGGQRVVDVEFSVAGSPGLLGLSQTAVELVAWAGGPAASASVGLINSGESPLLPTVNASPVSWLTAQASGASLAAGATTPLEITANPGTLATGRYTGSVTASSATAGNGPQIATVGFSVMPANASLPPDVQVTGIALTSLSPQGSITLPVAPGGGLSFTAVVAGANAGWLHVTPTSGTVPANGALRLSVTGDATGLTPSLYAAAIGIGLSDGTSRTVPVEFFVPAKATQAVERAATAVCATANAFVAHLLSPVPNFFVRTGRALPVKVQAENCDGTPASNLEITGQYGTQTLTLVAEGPGVWSASWVPQEDNAKALMKVAVSGLRGGQRLTNTFEVQGVVNPSAIEDPLVTAVVGGANPVTNQAVAVGSWISIYGSNFATVATTAQTGTLPATLGSVEVFLGDQPVRLYYVGPQQVNGIVPKSLSPGQRYQLLLRRNGTPAAPFAVTVTDVQPGLFTQNQQGTGQAAAVIAGTRTLAASGSAVARGGAIEVYATGLGAVQSPPVDGEPASLTVLSRVVEDVQVTVGGRAARVLFAGLTPGTIGLYQINVEIPSDSPTGDAVPVVVTQKGVASNAATIAVR